MWWVVLAVVLALGGLWAWVQLTTPVAPMPEALAILEPDAQVDIVTEDWLVFSPTGEQPAIGFIYYPGGRVDPRAYAPYARAIAEEGYLCIVVPMPLGLAVLAPDSAGDVIAQYSEIDTWVIGGHSLGGAMAAQFAASHVSDLAGLVLVAAYPAGNNDLSEFDQLAVLSVYGSEDGLALSQEIEESRVRLPQTAEFVRIEGANHAQFGWYGPQAGDNAALISREDQQAQTVQAILALLDRVGGG